MSVSALHTAFDEKSLFPSYILEFEKKMKNYHAMMLGQNQVCDACWDGGFLEVDAPSTPSPLEDIRAASVTLAKCIATSANKFIVE